MSEQAVKTEPKKLKSKVFKWTSAIVAIAILEAAAVSGAVLIMESKHNDRQKDFATLSETVLQQGKHIAELQTFRQPFLPTHRKLQKMQDFFSCITRIFWH